MKLRAFSATTLALGIAAALLLQAPVAQAQPGSVTAPQEASADSDTAGDAGGTGGSDADAASDPDAGSDGGAESGADAGSDPDAGSDSDGADGGSDGAADPERPTDPADGADGEGPGATGPDAAADGGAEPAEPEDGASGDEGTADADSDAPEEGDEEGMRTKRVPRAAAAANSLSSGFNAGYIISDANFYDGNAMTAAQIQTFLDQRLRATADGRCTIGEIIGNTDRRPGAKFGNTIVATNCLADSRWTTSSMASNSYCKAYTGGTKESAATVIAKVSRACGISPRVLLIVLEKEQHLLTDTWPTALQFNSAMGYDCPDTAPCNPAYATFFKQVYYSAWQLQVYKAHPDSYRYKPFQTNPIQWHPNIDCGTSQVYIENWATAALYIYTPYRPNQAALNAGWGTGDPCSSYGNRNFYQFYKQWFGSPNSYFPDVPAGHQFFKEIEWMGSTGLSTGIKSADGRVLYKPKDRVTREAMAAFLYRLEGANYKGPATSPFADMKPGDKFYNEITWMYAKGYSTGIKQPSGKPIYAPKDRVSREAMAAFIYRLEGAKYNGPATSPFADMKRGDKFYNEITWMRAQGLTTGIKQPSGKPIYAPKDRVSREAMAAFIYRLEH